MQGAGAIVFSFGLKYGTELFLGNTVGYLPPSPEGLLRIPPREEVNWVLLPIVTTLGGLLTGLIVYTFAPEAEGHETDAVINAFHRQGGKEKGTTYKDDSFGLNDLDWWERRKGIL